MNYATELESRPYAPIVFPEIPRREMVIPMPGHWLDEMEAHGVDPGAAVAQYVCSSSHCELVPVTVRADFLRVWCQDTACNNLSGRGNWKRVLVPIREDTWLAIEQAAELVNCPVHEVFLKVLARQIKVYSKPPSPVPPVPLPKTQSNIVPGPWKPSLCGKVEA